MVHGWYIDATPRYHGHVEDFGAFPGRVLHPCDGDVALVSQGWFGSQPHSGRVRQTTHPRRDLEMHMGCIIGCHHSHWFTQTIWYNLRRVKSSTVPAVHTDDACLLQPLHFWPRGNSTFRRKFGVSGLRKCSHATWNTAYCNIEYNEK